MLALQCLNRHLLASYSATVCSLLVVVLLTLNKETIRRTKHKQTHTNSELSQVSIQRPNTEQERRDCTEESLAGGRGERTRMCKYVRERASLRLALCNPGKRRHCCADPADSAVPSASPRGSRAPPRAASQAAHIILELQNRVAVPVLSSYFSLHPLAMGVQTYIQVTHGN